MKFSPNQHDALRLIAEGRFYPALVREDDGWYARWRAIGGENEWVDFYVRRATVSPLTEDAEDQRHETLHDAWLMALRSRSGLVRWEDAACAEFASVLSDWSGNADEDVSARAGIVFRLESDREGFRVTCAVPEERRSLRALGQAAYVWGSLRGLRRRPEDPAMLSVPLTIGEAEAFLHAGARDLANGGYGVEGVGLAASVTAEVDWAAPTNRPDVPARAAGDMRLTVRVAGERVTSEDIRFLLDQGSTLVFFRDRWIEVDRNILREALRALEKGIGRKPNLLSFALGIGHVGSLEISTLRAGGWVRGLLERLGRVTSDPLGAVSVPGLRGTLRAYQERGVAWLRFMTENGFGALLADDMGLGKTVQTIAWMLATPRQKPVLVVAPLTLLFNWEHELAHFAPSLGVYRHQGEMRHLASGFRRAVCEADVVLTSYTLLVREYAAFAELEWDALVLDEAQAVKNPETQVSRAVRALSPRRRIALTGTPVENSLADLWALEDFLNPGFLGDARTFRERFVRPLAFDPNAACGRRLRHALEPMVLRRLKTDKAIAAELGEKREVREYCGLAADERRAYENALAEFAATAHAPGDVFALLTRLKLVCDGESKRARLLDLLENIFDAGESALVFTQYAKVGAVLQQAMAERFKRPMPFLHGELSPAERQRAIAAFNRPGPRAFVLSLKAGGFGLNLTKATHVIHFDRWWNPAVENQATDRAHRIGQKRDVLVHLMITTGTLEERIDGILAEKRTLKDLVADGEAFWNAVRLI